MTSQANGGAAKSSRFELPALNLNFGSITDGTDIPPPPDSPVQKEPTPPQTPTKVIKKDDTVPVPANGTNDTPKSNGKLAGTKRSADEAPLSPPVSTRQGSLRRLFSRSTLNNSYLEGQTATTGATLVPRPQSQGGASLLDDRNKTKRSSSWFKRFRSSDTSSKRASVILSNDVLPPATPKTPAPAGPPPPMIPELSEFEKDEGGLGADLFKNIK